MVDSSYTSHSECSAAQVRCGQHAVKRGSDRICCSYRLSRRKQIIVEHFDAPFDDDWIPLYNLAPAQPVPVICQHPKEPRRVPWLMHWGGLIPSWDYGPEHRLQNQQQIGTGYKNTLLASD